MAVKIIKNKKIYAEQSIFEEKVIYRLNNILDPRDKFNIIRILDSFNYKSHRVMVFEFMHQNLIDVLKNNFFRGLKLSIVRFCVKNILEATNLFHNDGLAHGDLKPENILIKIKSNPQTKERVIECKVADFGSAMSKNKLIYQYIQSRYYRAPEVLLQLRYSNKIDIWSIGCIAFELFFGLPLFEGQNSLDQLKKILETVEEENLPQMVECSKFKRKIKMESIKGKLKVTFLVNS